MLRIVVVHLVMVPPVTFIAHGDSPGAIDEAGRVTAGDGGTSAWWTIRTTSRALPFQFRRGHPTSFKPKDFAIWALVEPDGAARVFQPVLLDAFAYSWKGLLALLDAGDPELNVEALDALDDAEQAIRLELRFWGNLFSAAWLGSRTGEPRLFKLIPPSFRTWAAARMWLMPDGVTPRVYTFGELARARRVFIPLNPESDDPWEEIPNADPGVPNIGPQLVDDPMELALLMPGFGFDAHGKITYVGEQQPTGAARPRSGR